MVLQRAKCPNRLSVDRAHPFYQPGMTRDASTDAEMDGQLVLDRLVGFGLGAGQRDDGQLANR